jgi:curli production assembly/transport component CsgG
MLSRKALLALSSMALALGGCAVNNGASWAPAQFVHATPAALTLLNLPAPDKKIPVAVYGFTDQTGQFKPSDNIQTLSRAITQGGSSILVKALQDAGNRQWFQIIEREHLDDLLRERSVIREMRANYLGENGVNPRALPPLLFAGILLEGGVISYDSNTKTGGLGARFLGIGGNTSYREDTVTVYLRAVSTKTGEVLVSVNSRKSIASVGIASNTFRYVGFQDLLEVDAGVTANEPSQLALQQAIEKAVYGLVMEGAEQRLWCFADTPDKTSDLLRKHLADRDHIKPADVKLPVDASGQPVTGSCKTGAVTAHLDTSAMTSPVVMNSASMTGPMNTGTPARPQHPNAEQAADVAAVLRAVAAQATPGGPLAREIAAQRAPAPAPANNIPAAPAAPVTACTGTGCSKSKG